MSSSTPAGRASRGRAWKLRAAFVLCGLALTTTGCLTIVDVEAEDSSVFFAGGRISYELGEDDEPEEQDRSGAEAATLALELDATLGGASATQRLGGGEGIEFGGETFTGEVDVLFDLTRVRGGARASLPLGRGFAAEFFGGLEYSSMDVEVRNPGLPVLRSAQRTVDALGPALGLGVAWHASRSWRLLLEGQVAVGLSSDSDLVEQYGMETGLAGFPADWLGLFAGWRSTAYRAEVADQLGSDLDLKLAGPTLAVWLRF